MGSHLSLSSFPHTGQLPRESCLSLLIWYRNTDSPPLPCSQPQAPLDGHFFVCQTLPGADLAHLPSKSQRDCFLPGCWADAAHGSAQQVPDVGDAGARSWEQGKEEGGRGRTASSWAASAKTSSAAHKSHGQSSDTEQVWCRHSASGALA